MSDAGSEPARVEYAMSARLVRKQIDADRRVIIAARQVVARLGLADHDDFLITMLRIVAAFARTAGMPEQYDEPDELQEGPARVGYEISARLVAEQIDADRRVIIAAMKVVNRLGSTDYKNLLGKALTAIKDRGPMAVIEAHHEEGEWDDAADW